MEINSGKISLAVFYSEVEFMTDFLNGIGIDHVKVAWGYFTNLDIDKMWHYEEINVKDLSKYIADGIKRDIYLPNQSDFHISSVGETLEFKLCHESDIHFISDNKDYVNDIKEHWVKKGFDVYEKHGTDWIKVAKCGGSSE